jgi:hypothetical protein
MPEIMKQVITAALPANLPPQIFERRLLLDVDLQKSGVHQRRQLREQTPLLLVDIEGQRVVGRIPTDRTGEHDEQVEGRIDWVAAHGVGTPAGEDHQKRRLISPIRRAILRSTFVQAITTRRTVAFRAFGSARVQSCSSSGRVPRARCRSSWIDSLVMVGHMIGKGVACLFGRSKVLFFVATVISETAVASPY